jgi:hypothetical protein
MTVYSPRRIASSELGIWSGTLVRHCEIVPTELFLGIPIIFYKSEIYLKKEKEKKHKHGGKKTQTHEGKHIKPKKFKTRKIKFAMIKIFTNEIPPSEA